MILLSEVMNESNASDQAKKLGLDYMSFGRWGKDGKVTHKSQGNKLVPVDKPTTFKSPNKKPSNPFRTEPRSTIQRKLAVRGHEPSKVNKIAQRWNEPVKSVVDRVVRSTARTKKLVNTGDVARELLHSMYHTSSEKKHMGQRDFNFSANSDAQLLANIISDYVNKRFKLKPGEWI